MTTSNWVKLGSYLSLFLIMVFLVGVFLINFSMIFAILGGVLLGGLLLWCIRLCHTSTISTVITPEKTRDWWPRWMKRLSTILILFPFAFLIIILLGTRDLVFFNIVSFVGIDSFQVFLTATVGLAFLLGIVASVPIEKSLSSLVTRTQTGRWWWVWIQRFLITLVLSMFFFPFLLILSPIPPLPDIYISPLATAGFVLILALLSSYPIEKFLFPKTEISKNHGWQGKIRQWNHLIIFVFSIIFFVIWALPLWFLDSEPVPISATLPVVAEYHIAIKPVDSTLKNLKIEEEGILDGEMKLLSERQISGTSRGFLLREVRITPLEADASGYVNLILPDGSSLRGPLCGSWCPQSTVELRDFPKNSFFDAKNAEQVGEPDTYVEVETIILSIRDLEQGIVFAYIPPPYHYFRPMLAPFVGLSSFGEIAIVIFSLTGTIILVPIVQPIIYNLAKSRLQSWFKKESKEKSVKTATLIVSSKGEVKEVEVNED